MINGGTFFFQRAVFRPNEHSRYKYFYIHNAQCYLTFLHLLHLLHLALFYHPCR